MELTPEDVERIRRSIAMSSTVPVDQVLPLLDTIQQLWDDRARMQRAVERCRSGACAHQ